MRKYSEAKYLLVYVKYIPLFDIKPGLIDQTVMACPFHVKISIAPNE
jgi:hypothetical protein